MTRSVEHNLTALTREVSPAALSDDQTITDLARRWNLTDDMAKRRWERDSDSADRSVDQEGQQ